MAAAPDTILQGSDGNLYGATARAVGGVLEDGAVDIPVHRGNAFSDIAVGNAHGLVQLLSIGLHGA